MSGGPGSLRAPLPRRAAAPWQVAPPSLDSGRMDDVSALGAELRSSSRESL